MFKTVLLLTPVYVTLFWAIVLLCCRRGEENIPAKYLGKLMFVAFILYMSHFFYFQRMYGVYIWLDGLYNLASLSVYPMYYLYARSLVLNSSLSFRETYPYFIAPFTVFFAIVIGFSVLSDHDQHVYIEEVIYGVRNSEGLLRCMYRIYVIEKIVFIVQLFYYVMLTTKLVNRHHEFLGNSYSFSENLSLKWVQAFNITLFLVSGASVVSAIVGRERFVDDPVKLVFPAVVFSVVLFTIGALGNRQKPVILIRPDEGEEEICTDEKIPARLKEELMALFEHERIYLEKDLTIYDITERLGTNRTYVSRVFKTEFGINFATFVNNLRVEHAKELLLTNRVASMEEIAELSGFGSTNSFYRAFLAKEKMSLSQYRKSIRR
jgi:AraC-like DNA-binding protein